MPTRNAHTSRPAFTLVPLALILWIALLVIGVLLWQKTPPPNYVPAKGVGPGQIGSVILAVLYGGFWFWSLGKLAEKKGQVFANIAAVIVMGLAALMMGLSYAGLTKDQRNLAANSPPASPASSSNATTTFSAPPRGPAISPAPSNRVPSTQVPSTQVPSTQAPSAVPESPGTSPPSTAPDRVRPTPPQQEAPNPVIKTTTDTLQKELESDIAAFIQLANKAVPPLANQVPHDLRQVNSRLADVTALKSQAQALDKALSSASETLRSRLESAGVPSSETTHISVRWSMDFNASRRSHAAGQYADITNRSIEEITLLRDNFGKWTLTSKGEMRVTDNALKSKLSSLRFFVAADVARHQQMRDQLTGN